MTNMVLEGDRGPYVNQWVVSLTLSKRDKIIK